MHIQDFVDQHSASVICFNLGYLPFADSKAETATKQETTVAAVKAALEVVKETGIVTVMAYVGHPCESWQHVILMMAPHLRVL